MREITVKRITPDQLTPSQRCQFYVTYGADGAFAAIYENRTAVLYVNDSVPDEDVEKFVQYVSYPGDYINMEESEGGLLGLSNDIIEQYGLFTWRALIDAYQYRRKERWTEEAEAAAGEIIPQIEELDNSAEPPVAFNDFLAYYISQAGSDTKHRTANNMVGYGTKYVFWLGYLAGAGQLKEGGR